MEDGLTFLSEILLPKGQDSGVFLALLQEKLIPAVSKSPTRVGAIVDLILLEPFPIVEGDDFEMVHHYYLLTVWSGIDTFVDPFERVHDKKLLKKFHDFHPQVNYLGKYFSHSFPANS